MESIQTIITRVGQLQPLRAIGNKIHQDSLCSTGVIDELEVGGTVIKLSRSMGKYAACYVRVSSEQQKKDGFSAQDQVRRLVEYCVEKKLAFRIFSDAEISGNVSIDDPRLQASAMKTKAEYYEDAYKKVFLAAPDLSPEVRASSEKYLAKQVNNIKRGRSKDLDVEMGEERAKVKYRPGLSIIMADLATIHTIVATDWSRISRNHALSMAILEAIGDKVNIVGVVEPLDAFSKRDIGAQFVQFAYSAMAAYYLRSLTINILRGFHQMLSDGIPNGPIPKWCTRQAGGKAILNHRAESVRTMVKMFLELGEGGYKLARKLNEAGVPPPTGYRVWTRSYIRQILSSPTLIGYQDQYGRWWETLEAVIDEETFHRVQILLAKRREAVGYNRPRKTDGYLMTSLIRCWCGSPLVFHPHSSGPCHYVCVSSSTMKAELKKTHGSKPHISFLAEDTDEFFTLYFKVFAVKAATSMFARSNRETQEDSDRLDRLRLAFEQDKLSIEKEVRAEAKKMNFRNEAVIQSMLEERTQERKREIEVAEQQLKNRVSRGIPSFLTAVCHGQDGTDRIVFDSRLWEEMSTGQKNALLRVWFDRIQVYEDEQSTFAVAVLNDEANSHLPRIQVDAVSNARSVKRRWTRDLKFIDDLEEFGDQASG